jgi:hypothetical protein
MRKYLPGFIVPEIFVTSQVEPAADVYCTDHPATETGEEPRL